MALVLADLVQENTSTTGTGTLTLTGATSAQFQTFASIGDGNTTYYRIISGNNSEVGIGTYTLSGTTLSRDTVLSSIIGGVAGTTKITVASGATVICTYPAEKAVLQDATNNVNVPSATVGTTANYQSLVGAVTTKTPIHSVAGSDTNIALALQSKGTGGIDLVTGSAGVNISNGTTITNITQTAGGSYTSIPTVAITAPTTDGGVQATATVSVQAALGTTIASGGSGYTVGDVITVSGGTFATSAQFTVATVSAGVITGITLTTAGTYSATPTNPVSVTGGTGSGATLTMQWTMRSGTFVITNAGSGYIEQPTVSFSGGGGSGATAFATVGSGTIVRSLGSSIDFATPNGIGLRVFSNGVSANLTDYVELSGGTSGVTNGVYVRAQGSTTNNSLYIQSKGTGVISFYTNWILGAAEQMRVSHTASAVNYVQVTGGATTKIPTISSQGTDANISLALLPKGTGIVLTNQNTPVAADVTATLLIANLLSQIITSTSATAVALTLPTGTLTDAGISGGTSAVNTAFEWSIINLGSASGAVTLGAGTGHTIVGSGTIAISTTGRFKTVKTATNTFITYRIA